MGYVDQQHFKKKKALVTNVTLLKQSAHVKLRLC